MFLYLGDVWMPPHLYTPIHLYTPSMFVHPQGCTHPICPHTLLCICVFGGFACCGGYNGLPFVLGHPPLHHPICRCLLFNYTPHTQSLVPCALVCFRDISMLCGHFPFVEGFGGVSPISLEASALGCHMLILLPFL